MRQLILTSQLPALYLLRILRLKVAHIWFFWTGLTILQNDQTSKSQMITRA
jgi:hypothetical protein